MEHSILHFVQCTDADCATSVQTTPLLSPADDCNTGWPDYTSIPGRYCACADANEVVIGSNGLPQILFDWQNTYDQDFTLSIASCNDAACGTVAVTDVAQVSNEDAISGSMVLGPDGYPRIVYVDENSYSPISGPVYFVQCTSVACDERLTTGMGTASSGFSVDIAIGTDGLARIAFEDSDEGHVDLIQCTGDDCSENDQASVPVPLGDFAPVYLGVGQDGNPGIAVGCASPKHCPCPKSTILHNFLNRKICHDYGACSTLPG